MTITERDQCTPATIVKQASSHHLPQHSELLLSLVQQRRGETADDDVIVQYLVKRRADLTD